MSSAEVLRMVSGPPLQPSPFEPTLPAQLLANANEHGTEVAVRKKHLGKWKQYTWAEVARRVADAAGGLAHLGVRGGDRVVLQSSNRPAWLLVDLAVQGLGAITVGSSPASPAAELGSLLRLCGATVIVVEDEEQLDKVLEVRDECPNLRSLVIIDPLGVDLGVADVVTFHDLEQMASASAASRYADAVVALDPAQPAIIACSSGTAGAPRAVLLSHANLRAAAAALHQLHGLTPEDEVLSYLPLCGIAERAVSVVGALYSRYVVNFGGVGSFASDVRVVQPTLFLGQPVVWDSIAATVQARMQDASRVKQVLYRRALASGYRRTDQSRIPRGALGRFSDRVWWLVVRRPLLDKLGLRRTRVALCAGGALRADVFAFFAALGVRVLEGYGLTESVALATSNCPDRLGAGSAGAPAPGVDVAIASDGEILTRGPSVFMGYFADRVASAKAVDADGWLHTGDVGALDEAGMLHVTARKRSASGRTRAVEEVDR